MGIRDLEDVLSVDDMVVTLEAALMCLTNPVTLEELGDHLDVTAKDLSILRSRINYVLNGD